MTASPIATILQHLREEPSRTWSIVITIFGDAVMPRGGSLWMGSLLKIFAGMGIGAGVVRTSMSRLAADGWLQRSRLGRNSFYRLTETGRTHFATASRRIYGRPPETWDGQFHMLIQDAGSDREAVRHRLEQVGFGSPAPNVWIAPSSTPPPADLTGLLYLLSQADVPTGQHLAGRAWALGETAAGYERFLAAFGPVGHAIVDDQVFADLDAIVARTLLIHEYRRVVLRDPLLPDVLLPPAWPGTAARHLAGQIYAALLTPSERWLDRHGHTEDGTLPPPSFNLSRRFAQPSGRREHVTEIS